MKPPLNCSRAGSSPGHLAVSRIHRTIFSLRYTAHPFRGTSVGRYLTRAAQQWCPDGDAPHYFEIRSGDTDLQLHWDATAAQYLYGNHWDVTHTTTPYRHAPETCRTQGRRVTVTLQTRTMAGDPEDTSCAVATGQDIRQAVADSAMMQPLPPQWSCFLGLLEVQPDTPLLPCSTHSSYLRERRCPPSSSTTGRYHTRRPCLYPRRSSTRGRPPRDPDSPPIQQETVPVAPPPFPQGATLANTLLKHQYTPTPATTHEPAPSRYLHSAGNGTNSVLAMLPSGHC